MASEQVIINLIDFKSSSHDDDTTQLLDWPRRLLQQHWKENSQIRLKFLHAKQDYLMTMEYFPSVWSEFPVDPTIMEMLFSDEEFMTRAVMFNGKIIERACPSLRDKLAIKAVQQDGLNIGLFDRDEIKQYDGLLMEAVKQNGCALELVSSDCHYMVTEEVATEAIKNDGHAFQYLQTFGQASSHLLAIAAMDDPFVVEEVYDEEYEDDDYYLPTDVHKYIALNGGDMPLYFHTPAMEFFKRIVKEHPDQLERINAYDILSNDDTNELQRIALKYSQAPLEEWYFGNEPSIVDESYLSFVKHCGEMLYYAKNQTKEMVLLAVKNNGEAIQYANEEFLEDQDVILEAIKTEPFAIQYTDKLYQDWDFILECVKQNGEILSYIWEDYGDDYEIVLNAVTNYGLSLQCASEDLQKEREIVLAAVSNNGEALEYAHPELQNDKEVIIAAVSNYGNAIRFALQQDKEIVKKAISSMPQSVEYVKEEYWDKEIISKVLNTFPQLFEVFSNVFTNDKSLMKEMALIAIKHNSAISKILFEMAPELENDRDFVKEVVKTNGYSLAQLAEHFKDDLEIVTEAVKSAPCVIAFASDRLKQNWKLRKLEKELKDKHCENWFDYWKERTKVYDIPKPKRFREDTKEFDESYDPNSDSEYCEYCSSESEDESDCKKRKVDELLDDVE